MSLVFVTGGSRGLGFATASALKQMGYDLVLFAKDESRLKEAAAKLSAKYEVVDLEDIAQTREVFKNAVEKYGVPQVLMLAHGVMSDKMAKTLKTTDAEWRRVKIGRAHV